MTSLPALAKGFPQSPGSRFFRRLFPGLVIVLAAAWFLDLNACHAPAQEALPVAQQPVAPEGPAASLPVEAKSVQPPAAAEGHGEEQSHAGEHDPVAPLLGAIVLILFGAKVCGDLAERIGMPAVLAELLVGVLLGNMLFLTGWDGLQFLHPPVEKLADPYATGSALKMLAGIGVVLLLFEVGLESNVGDMLKVGLSSLIVATLGVVAPMILGFLVGRLLLPQEEWYVWLFLGATLSATSVGITARVLKDLGRAQQAESKIILGAAVIDDVMGLIVLAVVGGIITAISEGKAFDIFSLGIIILKAVGFLFGAILLGNHLVTKPMFKAATYLKGHGLLVVTALLICFGFAYLAALVSLAPIVGAFAAGLILEHAHYEELGAKEGVQLETALKPLSALLVPIFFVQMGIMVDLSKFADSSVWLLAGALTFVAIVGKQVCAFGVLEKGLDRLSVGIGMIPRGEVGLIFAAYGFTQLRDKAGAKIVDESMYSAIVVMVMLTTLITPPVLKWSMNRKREVAAPAA